MISADTNFFKWIKIRYYNTVKSIAFLPAVIALAFLLGAWFMVIFDFSDTGKQIKSELHWLSLKDASTARSIISVIATGVLSLTVFSFSMVMIVLNQAASQLSNRILDKLIGNRFQQIVLGFYIGTIVFALFLLSTIRDINSGIYVPALSTYLLILLTVTDIFLFISFLHYITQSVKYETIIYRIYKQTDEVMRRNCCLTKVPEQTAIQPSGVTIKAHSSGIFQGFDKKALLELCAENNLTMVFLLPASTYVLQGTPLFTVANYTNLDEGGREAMQSAINIHRGEDINNNYMYGLRQLMEVAIKALSPGINDPGTAVLSLHALADLLAYRLQHFPETTVRDEKGIARIEHQALSFTQIFEICLFPIWDYGQNDRLVQQAMHLILPQLQRVGKNTALDTLQQEVEKAVSSQNL